jgi:NADH-quinone oxidoreductase subunit N
MNFSELPIIASILIPTLGACLLFAISIDPNHGAIKWMRTSMFLLTTIILIASIIYITNTRYCNTKQYPWALQIDRLSQFGMVLALLTTIITVLQLWDHLHQEGWITGKPLASLLLCVSGMTLLSTTNNIFLIFLAIITMVTQLRTLTNAVDIRTNASCGNCCLLVSSITSALFCVGFVLLYISTNKLDTIELGNCITQMDKLNPIIIGGLVSLSLGFMVSMDAIPLLKWTPKIYNMSPHPTAILVSAAMNVVLILAFLRIMVLNLNLFNVLPIMRELITIFIEASIVWCSILMFFQTIIKKMLAYASSCHVGYLLLSIIANTSGAHTGMIFHLVAYWAISIGTFGMLSAFGLVGSKITFNQLRGLGWKNPILSIGISLCIFSMAGFPPTIGFYGKYMILKEIINQKFILLTIVWLASSLSLIYCCMRIPLALFVEKVPLHAKYELETKPTVLATFTKTTIILCALATILFGIMPGTILDNIVPNITRELTLRFTTLIN